MTSTVPLPRRGLPLRVRHAESGPDLTRDEERLDSGRPAGPEGALAWLEVLPGSFPDLSAALAGLVAERDAALAAAREAVAVAAEAAERSAAIEPPMPDPKDTTGRYVGKEKTKKSSHNLVPLQTYKIFRIQPQPAHAAHACAIRVRLGGVLAAR
jgi:hypothetical protein